MKTPLEPFVRATYRWNRTFGDDWLWRLEPRVFVQNQRGAGISVQNVVDHMLDDTWLLRSYSVVVAEEEVEGVSWTTKLIAYQNLSKKHALSYAVYGTGETDYEVPLRDYGFELRYRRQISREWLFIELLTYVNWPRDFPDRGARAQLWRRHRIRNAVWRMARAAAPEAGQVITGARLPSVRRVPTVSLSVTIPDPDKAPVAQLDRVLPSEGRGHRFESCRARQ